MHFHTAACKKILAVNHYMLICKNFSTIEMEQSMLFSCEHTQIMLYVFNKIMSNNRKNGLRPLYSW
jgi:hypothetical protein